MRGHPERWPFRNVIRHEFGSAYHGLRSYRALHAIVCLCFIAIGVVVIYYRTDAEVADLLFVLAAAIIQLLRLVVVIAGIYWWVFSKLIQSWVDDALSERWLKRERQRRPNQSFEIPFWRFRIPAAVARSVVFIGYLALFYFLLVELPNQNDALAPFVWNGIEFPSE